ncbi:hypothetical protein GGF50DRAFT_127103 [Schizophyllum commune]
MMCDTITQTSTLKGDGATTSIPFTSMVTTTADVPTTLYDGECSADDGDSKTTDGDSSKSTTTDKSTTKEQTTIVTTERITTTSYSTPPPTTMTTQSSSTQEDGAVTVIEVTVTSTGSASPVVFETEAAQTRAVDAAGGTKASANLGAIIGGTVGGVAFVAIVAFLAWWWIKRRTRYEDLFYEKTEQEIISKGAAKAVSEYERSLNSSVEPKAYQYGLVGQTNAPGGYPPMAADPFARPATPSSAHGHHRPMSMSGQQLAPGPYGSRPGTPRSPGYNMPPPGNMSPSGHMSPGGNIPPRGHSPSGSFSMPPPMMMQPPPSPGLAPVGYGSHPSTPRSANFNMSASGHSPTPSLSQLPMNAPPSPWSASHPPPAAPAPQGYFPPPQQGYAPQAQGNYAPQQHGYAAQGQANYPAQPQGNLAPQAQAFTPGHRASESSSIHLPDEHLPPLHVTNGGSESQPRA